MKATMKATLNGKTIAESDDIVENDGYIYFPPAAVRTEWLEKAPVTEKDRACPHGVQFYDVVIEACATPATPGSTRRHAPPRPRPKAASASGRTSRSAEHG
jgi:hypothetical protein